MKASPGGRDGGVAAARVCVFAPSPLLTVTIECAAGEDERDEVHVHAGGQGFWIARLAAVLGADVVVCATFGGETGGVVRTLIDEDDLTVRAIETSAGNGVYVHDRRTGQREELAFMPPAPLTRHEVDELYGIALVEGLEAAVTVLGGPAPDEPVVPSDVYRRLAADLRANGGVVVADLSGEPLEAVLVGGVDVLKVSHDELQRDGRAADDDVGTLVEGMRRLVEEGASQVIVTPRRPARPGPRRRRARAGAAALAGGGRGPGRRRLAHRRSGRLVGQGPRHPRGPAARGRRRSPQRHPPRPGHGYPRRDRAAGPTGRAHRGGNAVRALITNDDGVESTGLRVLAQVAVAAGLDVTVAAPGWDSSGASASLTSVEDDGRFLMEERRLEDTDVRTFAVEAAPAFIVRAAATGAFGDPPDIVLSGMNHGRNTGHAVLHSGTVGAALTATTHGMRGLAVSIDSARPSHWDTAAMVAGLALRWVMDAGDAVVLNVNVPDVAVDALGGFERARLAAFGAVQTTVTERGVGYVKFQYVDVDAELEPGTDAALLAAGVACYTPLLAVCEAGGVDTTSLEGVLTRPA